jgi:predicted nucleic acid-binding protein
MVLLIDANILLDVLLNRAEFVQDSATIWKLCEVGKAKGYISALTFANMMYIMRKHLTAEQIQDTFQKLSLIFEFAELSVSILDRAVSMQWKDFEDAIQSATARATHADYIITRNVKDFVHSDVPALMPAELLNRL